MTYQEKSIKYETKDFWVLDVGEKGFEVYQTGITASTRVASIGHGETLGLPRAIQEADQRQADLDAERLHEGRRDYPCG